MANFRHMIPAIFGLAGEALTADERGFFRDADPAGYILFRRNCASSGQLRALTDSLRTLHGRDDLLIMIDQEGGRVQRMAPPGWPAFPSAEPFDRLYRIAPSSAIAAAQANATALALMLREAGINVNAAPLLDLRLDGQSAIIGDRSMGADPMQVAALGRAVLDGLQAGGVVGIVKHMPGHGRATLDSHEALPTVTATAEALQADMAPFRALAGAPMGMTAHIVYTAWDAERPASLSPVVIGDIIRREIGFGGLLMSDDLDMKALSGEIGSLAAGVVAAGCDIALNCWARMDDMAAIARALPEIGEASRARLDRAMASVAVTAPVAAAADLLAARDSLLALAAA